MLAFSFSIPSTVCISDFPWWRLLSSLLIPHELSTLLIIICSLRPRLWMSFLGQVSKECRTMTMLAETQERNLIYSLVTVQWHGLLPCVSKSTQVTATETMRRIFFTGEFYSFVLYQPWGLTLELWSSSVNSPPVRVTIVAQPGTDELVRRRQASALLLFCCLYVKFYPTMEGR